MKILEAPKQITMDNPIIITGVPSKNDPTPVVSSVPLKETEPDQHCLCFLFICFFLPGTVGACIDCCN